MREEGFLFHPSFIHFLGFLNKIRMRVILHHQTAFATFVQVNVPCSYPCAAAIPAIENAWENTDEKLSKPNSIIGKILCRCLSVVQEFFSLDGNVGVLICGFTS